MDGCPHARMQPIHINLHDLIYFQIRDKYYNMLTENEIWQIYTFYQMDFDLFGYEVDPKYLIRYYKS